MLRSPCPTPITVHLLVHAVNVAVYASSRLPPQREELLSIEQRGISTNQLSVCAKYIYLSTSIRVSDDTKRMLKNLKRKGEMFDELEAIRNKGYAIDDEERVVGV